MAVPSSFRLLKAGAQLCGVVARRFSLLRSIATIPGSGEPRRAPRRDQTRGSVFVVELLRIVARVPLERNGRVWLRATTPRVEESTCRNHTADWFQLVTMRLTSFNVLIPHDRNLDPKQSIEPIVTLAVL